MPRIINKALPVLVVLTGLALLLGIVGLYARTERQVIERHNEQQLTVVRAVATALGKEIDRRVAVFEETGRKLQPSDADVPDEARRRLDAAGFDGVALRPGSSGSLGEVITGQVVLGQRGILVPLRMPLSGNRVLHAQLVFRAFAPVIEMWNRRLGGRLWLLDDEGRLIYSQLHPDMLSRNALGGDRHCLECHHSFEMEAAMVRGESASVEHHVAERPHMLVYYAPVTFGARRWSLAMSDPQAEITALTRRGFLQASLLTALFLGLVVASGLGLMKMHRQKVEAERRVAIAENRARLEARMVRAEQLAAVGKMTAQIAHEINTPLASISLNVTYVLSELEQTLGEMPAELSEAAEEIQREVERLKTFTGECLKLTRIHSPQMRPVSLTGVVRGFLAFITREAKRRQVQLEVAFEGEPIHVAGDGDLLRQALLNVTRNAFDAMPAGGRLEITLFRTNGWAQMCLTDSGPGVADELREKIFDAFFTTKPEGTGLGLAVVRRIVEQHGGQIYCGGGPNGGARFEIRLPLAAEVTPAGEGVENEAPAAGRPQLSGLAGAGPAGGLVGYLGPQTKAGSHG